MSSDKEWMFCPTSGYLLSLDPKRQVAACPVSGYQRSLAELSNIKVVLRTDMEDYRRRFALEPLVKSIEDQELLKGRKRATVDEPCPKCNHRQLEYYTMQLRSADEGQTVFYECKNCGHKYSQNTPSISATLPAKAPKTGTKRKAEADATPCTHQRAEQQDRSSHVAAAETDGNQPKAEAAQAAKDTKAGELVLVQSHPDNAALGPIAFAEWPGLEALAALVAEASATAAAQQQLQAASAVHARELEEARRKTAAAEAILADATKRHGESLSEAQAALAFAAVQRAEELAMTHKTCQELGAARAARIQQLQDTVAALESAVDEKGKEAAALRAQHAKEAAVAAEAARSIFEAASQRHAMAFAELQKKAEQAQAETAKAKAEAKALKEHLAMAATEASRAASSVKDQLNTAELTEVRLRKQLQDLQRAEAQLREQLAGATMEVTRLKERPAVTPLKRQLAATQAEASRTTQQQRQHAQELADKAQKAEAELRRQLAASQAQATAAQQREQLAQDELAALKKRLDAASTQADTVHKQQLAMEKRHHDTEYDLRQQLSAAQAEAAAAQADAAAALDHAQQHEQQAQLSAEIRKQAVAQAASDNGRLAEQVRDLQRTEAALRRELDEQRKTARLTEAALLEQVEEQVKAARMAEAALRQELVQLRQADVVRQEELSRMREEALLRTAQETKRADAAEGAATEERKKRMAAEEASDNHLTERSEAEAALLLAQDDNAVLLLNLKAASEAAAHAINYSNHVATVLRVNGIVLPQPPGMGPPLQGVAASGAAPGGGWVLAMPGQQPPQHQAPGARLGMPTFMAPPAQVPSSGGATGPPAAQQMALQRQPPPSANTAAAPAQQSEAPQSKTSAGARPKIKLRRGPDTPLDKLAEAAAVLEANGGSEFTAQGDNKRARTAR